MVTEINRRGRADAMTGPQTRDEVYEHLRAADVYVFPSFTEGQPFTVIEALSVGVPIVASDIQAISAMITDEDNGHLVPVRDAEGFAKAITATLRDYDEWRRISERNRALACERFDRSVFRERIAEQYQTAAGRD